MINVISPLLLLLSSILATALLLYLAVFNNYYIWVWIFVGGSWATWLIIQWEDDFILTFLSPAFLPGFFVMKLLARKYKRA